MHLTMTISSTSEDMNCDPFGAELDKNNSNLTPQSSFENINSGDGVSIDVSSTSDENNNSLTANISVEDDGDDGLITTTDAMDELAKKEPVKRETFAWSRVDSFDTYTAAHESLVAEHYKKHGTKNGGEGSKTTYRCGKIKQKSEEQCKAKRRIFQSASTTDFEVQSNNATHTCDAIDKTQHAKSFSKAMKEMIVNCAKNHMKPKYIIEHIDSLRKDHNLFSDEETPNAASIYYILKVQKLIDAPKIKYLGELVEWCDSNMDTPTDIDQPFVIGFDHSDEEEELHFRVVVSTKRLIDHCKNITHLCVDATHNLTWHKYPFMVLGTVDRNKKFHPLCFGLCTQETTNDFKFIFDALSVSVEKHTDRKLQPEILISDACNAIRNAFMHVFPMALLMIMCYVHVLRNITKNKDKYKKENKDEIFKDIEMLHQSSSTATFTALSKLFMRKWKKKEPEFAKYFEKQWLASHCNWYFGAAEYTPTTNNALEGELFLFC